MHYFCCGHLNRWFCYSVSFYLGCHLKIVEHVGTTMYHSVPPREHFLFCILVPYNLPVIWRKLLKQMKPQVVQEHFHNAF